MRIFLIAIILSVNVYSQVSNVNLDYYFSQLDKDLNESIPKPQDVIGHNIGDWHVTHDKLVQYMYTLADVSDRISIENRGFTYENRPIVLLTITSKENHNSISEIQSSHKEITNFNKNIELENQPIVVYQGFSIHGNEASGSNASLLLAYYLAASESDFVKNLLDKTVILLDPSLNPDGLQRFSYWANSNKNLNLTSDPYDREYSEVWPSARTNHYWFDLNRDWLPVQLPESQARIKSFNKWQPNILTDHHEMGTNATFFFQPGVPSRTHPLTPKLNQKLTKKIAEYHIESLDEIGSLYYSEEKFDDFYYGKGSTFPDINGSIGILFEQASSRGHIQKTANGILTFPFTIKNQFTTAISTLKAAKNLRLEILDYQKTFFIESHKESEKFKNDAIIFGNTKDRYRTNKLAEILKRHEIDFFTLESDIIHNEKLYKKDFSYVIPKNQKKYRLINAMFETRTKFNDSLFYDVSSWTLPLAFNLDYDLNFPVKKALKKVDEIDFKGTHTFDLSNYAYLMEYHEYLTPRAVNKLLRKDVIIKVSTKPFEINGRKFDYGTILIPVLDNDPDKLYKIITEIGNDSHVRIHSVNTGYAEGPDLGSDYFKRLKKKNIGLLVGDGVISYDAGEIWHLLDTRYHITVNKLDIRDFEKINLDKYTTIISPSSNIKNPSVIKKIHEWVENGGILIGYKNSINWLKEANLLKVQEKESNLIAKDISFIEKSSFIGAQKIGGAIFETKIDRSHPINYGQTNSSMPIFRNSTIFLNQDPQSYNNPIKYSISPLISGYISKENLNLLKSTTPIKIQKVSKGKVIYITDNTNFRAFWYGTNKILMNAIFFSGIM